MFESLKKCASTGEFRAKWNSFHEQAAVAFCECGYSLRVWLTTKDSTLEMLEFLNPPDASVRRLVSQNRLPFMLFQLEWI